MKLQARTGSIEKAFGRTRASAVHSVKYATNLSLIPSLFAPLGKCELQDALRKANSTMALLDADGLQADTLLYAEERFFSLYESALQEANGAQLFLLLSRFAPQGSSVFGASHRANASYDLLLSQLCAALRASAKGKISLLMPSVGTLQEIEQVRQMIEQAMRILRAQNIPFDETVSLGIVLGTPASLLLSRKLIEGVDFVMIDTDLLARLSLNSTPVSGNFDHLLAENAEAILRLVEIGIGNAHLLVRFVMLGGSMVSYPRFLPHFLAMGATALVAPSQKLKNLRSLLRKVR